MLRLQLLSRNEDRPGCNNFSGCRAKIAISPRRLHEMMPASSGGRATARSDTGIDVETSNWIPGELQGSRYPATLRRRGTVAQWDCPERPSGTTLPMRRVSASSALAIVYVDGATLTDLRVADQPARAVWLFNNMDWPYNRCHRLPVCTWPPDLDQASPHFAAQLHACNSTFGNWSSRARRAQVLIFEFVPAPPSVSAVRLLATRATG